VYIFQNILMFNLLITKLKRKGLFKDKFNYVLNSSNLKFSEIMINRDDLENYKNSNLKKSECA